MEYEKIYVEVLVRFYESGGMRPESIVWKDGRKYAVDRVKYISRAQAHVSSLLPVRYDCVISGKDKYLYFEEEERRWFVEREVTESYSAQRP